MICRDSNNGLALIICKVLFHVVFIQLSPDPYEVESVYPHFWINFFLFFGLIFSSIHLFDLQIHREHILSVSVNAKGAAHWESSGGGFTSK
jgi:hypothetical protein